MCFGDMRDITNISPYLSGAGLHHHQGGIVDPIEAQDIRMALH